VKIQNKFCVGDTEDHSSGVKMRQKAKEDVYSSLVEEDKTLLCAAGKKTPLTLDVQVLNDCPHADQQSYAHNQTKVTSLISAFNKDTQKCCFKRCIYHVYI
jgi:hypothetical protein